MEFCIFKSKHMDLLFMSSRHALLLALILTCLYEPSPAFPTDDLQQSLSFTKQPQASTTPDRHKRVADMVDAWSLCPPDMEEAECFYTYLRVYARLRKAARETDRVSMRNIGKRDTTHNKRPRLGSMKQTFYKDLAIKQAVERALDKSCLPGNDQMSCIRSLLAQFIRMSLNRKLAS